MDHHPCLRKCKRNEDPNGIKRNQAFCLSIKNQEQDDGTNRQGQNPIRIAQTIPFSIYMCGMYLFLAMLKANIGKAEKPVLAATAKIKAVDNWKM